MELSRNEIIALYDIYGVLLTVKQRNYFEDYYYSDLSISEIAINYEISRNAVFDQIKRATQQLVEYEEKLKLKKKLNDINELNIDSDIKELIFNLLLEE